MATHTFTHRQIAEMAKSNPKIAALLVAMGDPGQKTKLERMLGFDVVIVPDNPPGPVPAAHSHLACFLYDNAKVTTHTILSDKMSDAAIASVLGRNTRDGCTVCYVSVANDRDYGDYPVRFNAARKERWRNILAGVIGAGMRSIAWGRQDDSAQLDQWPDAQLFAYWATVHAAVGDLFAEWVTCLEIDEVLKDAARAQQWTRELKRITGRPVGVHTTSAGNLHYAHGADRLYRQISTRSTPAQAVELLKKAQASFGGPVVMAEYHRSSDSPTARAIGDAVLAAGAAGVGTGFTPRR